MTLEFTESDGTLQINDPVERMAVRLTSDHPIDPAPTDTDFVYPVDAARRITTRQLTVDRAGIVVIDADGDTQEVVPANTTSTLTAGEYTLQVADDLKTYLHVHAPEIVAISTTQETAILDFQVPIDIDVGARSIADHPAATITTTTDPGDLAATISAFGTALKDTGPMRSYPTLRGHPPTVELGAALDIPDAVRPAESAITIGVPLDYDSLFPIAPLAYYLGATVEEATTAHVRTTTGFVHALEGWTDFETAVERTLKQVFVLECFARSAGPYGSGLESEADIADATGLDPEPLYHQSAADRLESMLDVPWEAIQPFVPRWSSTAYVDFVPENIPYLPFLVDDLAVIRTPAVAERRTVTGVAATGEEFTRTATTANPATTDTTLADMDLPAPFLDPAFRAILDPVDLPGEFAEDDAADTLDADEPDQGPGSQWLPSTRPELPEPGSTTSAVVPESTTAESTVWLADGIPLTATNPTIEAYRHGLDRTPVDEIEVIVVCNDARMAAEDDAVRRLLSADTQFDVTVRPFHGLHTDELAELLRRGADFLHYVGHIDDGGFVCPDGRLDAAGLDEVNVDACFLNACQSIDQGRALVDAGAIASVVTLTDVLNGDAVDVGTTMARLVNRGFPLAAALDVAADASAVEHYTLVGDGGFQLTENPTGALVLDAETTAAGVHVCLHSYITRRAKLGTMHTPAFDGFDGWYLTGADACGTVSEDALRTYLADSDHPVRFDGRFGWAQDWHRNE